MSAAPTTGSRLLNKSVPFLASAEDGTRQLMLDGACIRSDVSVTSPVVQRVHASLLLPLRPDETVPTSVFSELVEGQIEAGLTYVYSHEVWECWRRGRRRHALVAFLIESRHYLSWAAWRMSPAVAAAAGDPLEPLLLDHLVEEWDHARFFDDALAEIGLDARGWRSLPATRTWALVMRSVSRRSPIAAVCASGLLESSSVDHDTVNGWHDRVRALKLLPDAAVDAIQAHVGVDHDLGHGQVWRDALAGERSLPAWQAVDALNGIAAVADALYDWLTSLSSAPIGHHADEIPRVDDAHPPRAEVRSWPAGVYRIVSGRGDHEREPPALIAAYHGGLDPQGPGSELIARLRVDPPERVTIDELQRWITELQRAVAGASVWEVMMSDERGEAVVGWVLENAAYLGSARQHVSAALAACSDETTRRWLASHLTDEASHDQPLLDALRLHLGHDPARYRPLPTTLALREQLLSVAGSNWPAYCLSLVFLQQSHTPGASMHREFYDAVRRTCPAVAPVLDAMEAHDSTDEALGHQAEAGELLTRLVHTEAIDRGAIADVVRTAEVTWAFLEGIGNHYGDGGGGLASRLAWSWSSLE